MFRKTSIFIGVLLGALVIPSAEIDLETPTGQESGDIKFYGYNSTVSGGITDLDDFSERFGNVVKFRAYGDTLFDGHATNKIVYVNGMPANATVTVTYKNNSAVQSSDAIVAVEVYDEGG